MLFLLFDSAIEAMTDVHVVSPFIPKWISVTAFIRQTKLDSIISNDRHYIKKINKGIGILLFHTSTLII